MLLAPAQDALALDITARARDGKGSRRAETGFQPAAGKEEAERRKVKLSLRLP